MKKGQRQAGIILTEAMLDAAIAASYDVDFEFDLRDQAIEYVLKAALRVAPARLEARQSEIGSYCSSA